jgi:hypothetical protein
LAVPLWIVLMAPLILSPQTLVDRLYHGSSIRAGAESVGVDRLLASEFDRRSTSHLVLIEPAPPATTFASTQVRFEDARVSSDLAPLNARIAGMPARLTNADGRAWLALPPVGNDLPEAVGNLPHLETALQSDRLHARVTGIPALTAEFGSMIKTDLLRAESTAFAIALLMLTRFAGGWRHVLAIVLTTSTAVAALLLTITVLSHTVPVNVFALSVAAMLTIALSLDFGLLTRLSADEHGARNQIRGTLCLASGPVIGGMAGLTLLPFEAARSIGETSVLAMCIVAIRQKHVRRGAVLMKIVFLAFCLNEIAVVRAIGIAVLVAIIVTATVLRMQLLQAFMVLLGRWNWWWPSLPTAGSKAALPAVLETASMGGQR